MAAVEEVAVQLGNHASEEFRRAVEVLGKVGLTLSEARAYIALVARGVGDASSLAQAAGIPRTSAYKVLESLSAKGYAQPTGGKPILFRPTAPLDVAENLKGAIQEVFEKLATLHRITAEHGEPQLVYLLSGRDKVTRSKIGELLISRLAHSFSRPHKFPRSEMNSGRTLPPCWRYSCSPCAASSSADAARPCAYFLRLSDSPYILSSALPRRPRRALDRTYPALNCSYASGVISSGTQDRTNQQPLDAHFRWILEPRSSVFPEIQDRPYGVFYRTVLRTLNSSMD